MKYTEYQIQQMAVQVMNDEQVMKETEYLWGIGLMRYLGLIGPDEFPEQLLTREAAFREFVRRYLHKRNNLDDISHNVERRHIW